MAVAHLFFSYSTFQKELNSGTGNARRGLMVFRPDSLNNNTSKSHVVVRGGVVDGGLLRCYGVLSASGRVGSGPVRYRVRSGPGGTEASVERNRPAPTRICCSPRWTRSNHPMGVRPGPTESTAESNRPAHTMPPMTRSR